MEEKDSKSIDIYKTYYYNLDYNLDTTEELSEAFIQRIGKLKVNLNRAIEKRESRTTYLINQDIELFIKYAYIFLENWKKSLTNRSQKMDDISIDIENNSMNLFEEVLNSFQEYVSTCNKLIHEVIHFRGS